MLTLIGTAGMTMTNISKFALARRTAAMVALGAALSLASCAEGNYPSIGDITRISDASILTPAQRDAAVKEMEKERDNQTAQAAKGAGK